MPDDCLLIDPIRIGEGCRQSDFYQSKEDDMIAPQMRTPGKREGGVVIQMLKRSDKECEPIWCRAEQTQGGVK